MSRRRTYLIFLSLKMNRPWTNQLISTHFFLKSSAIGTSIPKYFDEEINAKSTFWRNVFPKGYTTFFAPFDQSSSP